MGHKAYNHLIKFHIFLSIEMLLQLILLMLLIKVAVKGVSVGVLTKLWVTERSLVAQTAIQESLSQCLNCLFKVNIKYYHHFKGKKTFSSHVYLRL